ncbi:MAG: ATP-binding protein [Acetobacteraceae bacterium]|nr:ATP-binding protein [Acetobacteraceae bacterium]
MRQDKAAKRTENIVQLQSARQPAPPLGLEIQRPQAVQPVPFESWVAAGDRMAASLLSGTKRLVLTGPAGTGKTMLVERVARILRAAGRTVTVHLADADPAPAEPDVILCVDEADRLPAPKLRRLLDGSEGTVVLIGLESLAGRLPPKTAQVTLAPLGLAEAQRFIEQWLAVNERVAARLEKDAMPALFELSGGVPRLLTILLSAGAWLAKSSGAPVIGAAHFREAAALRSVLSEPAEGEKAEPRQAGRHWGAWAAVAALALVAGAAVPIVPHLFPAETEQAFGHARDLASRAERWLRPEPPPPVQPAVAVQAPVAPRPAPITTVKLEPAQVAIPSVSPPAPLPEVAQPAPAVHQEVAPPPAVTPTVAAAGVAPEVLPAETVEFLLRRGREMMKLDDFSAARLLFRKAAEGGSPEAMLELGRTYDPDGHNEPGAAGLFDRDEARRWYVRAAAGGNETAAQRLAALPH